MNRYDYSRQVREKMIEMGLSKTEFSKYCHISRTTLDKILAGDVYVTLGKIFKVIEILNIPTNECE